MNTSRLRADIDAGRTGDKAPGEDPAAAPLGTDEEAAGTPIDPALAERVRRAEQHRDGEAISRQNAASRVEDAPASGNRTGGAMTALLWLGAGGAVGLALTVAVWALLR
jgi:hypothetical protein